MIRRIHCLVPKKTARILIILLMSFNIGCDQTTKMWASSHLASGRGEDGYTFLGGLFRLVYAENTGGMLSLGQHWPALVREFFLIYLPLTALLVWTLSLLLQKSHALMTALALTCIVSGGLSNVWDRLMHGYVVDFMILGTPSLRTGVFNVADVCIMFGIGLWSLSMAFNNPEPERT